RKDGAAYLQIGADPTEHAGGGALVGEYGQGREHALVDVRQVLLALRRAVRVLVELSERHRARELLRPGDRAEPFHESDGGPRAEDLRDRVGIEQVGHRISRAVGRRASQPAHAPRVAGPARPTRPTLRPRWPGRPPAPPPSAVRRPRDPRSLRGPPPGARAA